MTAVHIAYHDGAHRCYVTETGHDRRYVGCRHLVPRSAIAHSDALAERFRAPADGPSIVSVSPFPDAVGMGPSAGVLNASRRG